MRKKHFDYRKKTILYKKYKEEHKDRLEAKKIAENMQVETDKIVVRKVSFAGKFFEVVMDLFYRVGKVLVWLLACIIMSTGVVALLNPSIRQIILNYLPF
ncbi:MAG: hypothetical protein H2184_15880 [Candidatus Galacturonibacter soehngenii]|nr:hypothetical protein [Candidatus Galacturonibacter soehngenii]